MGEMTLEGKGTDGDLQVFQDWAATARAAIAAVVPAVHVVL